MIAFYYKKLVLKLWMWATRQMWPIIAYYTPNGKNQVKGVMLAMSEFGLKQMVFCCSEENPAAVEGTVKVVADAISE